MRFSTAIPGLLPSNAPARYLVRGKKASSYEYNVAVALDKYGLGYLFQVSYWGGRRLRGGIILDFLVFTVPMPTPLWVNGDYFHKGGKQATIDYLQHILLDLATQGRWRPAVVLWGKDTETIEAADASVKKIFGIA